MKHTIFVKFEFYNIGKCVRRACLILLNAVSKQDLSTDHNGKDFAASLTVASIGHG